MLEDLRREHLLPTLGLNVIRCLCGIATVGKILSATGSGCTDAGLWAPATMFARAFALPRRLHGRLHVARLKVLVRLVEGRGLARAHRWGGALLATRLTHMVERGVSWRIEPLRGWVQGPARHIDGTDA